MDSKYESDDNLKDIQELKINSEAVTLINSENIFDIDEKIIQYHLALNINEIKSKTLTKEFIKILSTSKSENQDVVKNNILFYY